MGFRRGVSTRFSLGRSGEISIPVAEVLCQLALTDPAFSPLYRM